jgi:hypothetical protein
VDACKALCKTDRDSFLAPEKFGRSGPADVSGLPASAAFHIGHQLVRAGGLV